MKPYPQSILLRLSDVSDANVSTGQRTAYVTTTLPAIVKGLRNLECQPDPFNEFQGPDALLDELLATLSGLEANGLDRGALVRAALCQEIKRREDAERQVATLTRERDEARQFVGYAVLVPGADEIFAEARRRMNATTPTPGAQA